MVLRENPAHHPRQATGSTSSDNQPKSVDCDAASRRAAAANTRLRTALSNSLQGTRAPKPSGKKANHHKNIFDPLAFVKISVPKVGSRTSTSTCTSQAFPVRWKSLPARSLLPPKKFPDPSPRNLYFIALKNWRNSAPISTKLARSLSISLYFPGYLEIRMLRPVRGGLRPQPASPSCLTHSESGRARN